MGRSLAVLTLYALALAHCAVLHDADFEYPDVEFEDDAVAFARGGASARAPRRPCECADGQCSCCSGFVMQSLINFAPRQRGCINITYDPDDFAFAMALSFNDRVLYKNTISAKNPRPLCVSVPRVTGAKLCVRLSNVYFVGRNVHACVDMEAKWQDSQAFQMTFDCIRVGADGVKVVKPEDGSGIAVGVPVAITPAPEEYDEIPAEHPVNATLAAATTTTTTTTARTTSAASTDVGEEEEEE
ncbi:uncharacterized protein LOC117646908 [Thrips palmi]|uniref:Uncharacterized protein LOC117646908 n=1 Tax=Thrips palmi TaxID=161013 RepID=A0A6P8YVI8_THRPL|nr:uncharacterized protein LOC117646908 [Thrips palmi]XP_034244118.1 uncharacterized protein LOC117646908 [Thrips palmi]